jgi:hypothetical protein
MLAPTLYGLSEIADGVYTDSPDQAEGQLRLLSQANAEVERFFNVLTAKPRYILCSTLECAEAFGSNGKVSLTYGWQAIQISPKALADPQLGKAIMIHERLHAELHQRMGTRFSWNQQIPNWFDEGLATFLSGDNRISLSHPQTDLDWIKHSKSVWNWGRFVKERGWKVAYGAAASQVAVIEQRVGRDGLRSLIERTLEGEDFDRVLAAMML